MKPHVILIMLQSLKPKLTRKVVNSARVNLNKYWNKFEELATAGRPLMSLEINHNRRCDNEMNDNTINERLDLLM